MFKTGVNEFLGHLVVVMDHRDIKDVEVRNQYKHSSSMISIAAMKIPEESIVTFKQYMKDSPLSYLHTAADVIEVNKPVIMVEAGLIEALSKEELTGMLHHEHAHIVMGDLDALQNINAGGGFQVVDEFELRADQYSAMINGNALVKSALVKTLKYQTNLYKELHGEDIYDELLENPLLAQRIKALS